MLKRNSERKKKFDVYELAKYTLVGSLILEV